MAKFIYIYIALKLKIKEFIIIIIVFFLSGDSYYTADLGSHYFLKCRNIFKLRWKGILYCF